MNVDAGDAGSCGMPIDIDKMTCEALCTLLAPFASGASSSSLYEPGSVAACRDAWNAAGQLPPRQAAMAIQASLRKNNYIETWQFVYSSMIDRTDRGGVIREKTISRHEFT